MAPGATNPFLSSQKASDSGVQAVLHPLVLLTISDYITRHSLREQQGPVVGALLGQQHGREVTIEHAYEVQMTVDNNGQTLPTEPWFGKRLDQMKFVHKAPQLDLVGWYTVLPKTGPTQFALPVHEWISKNYNESALLLGFHPDEAVDPSAGSKLPLTIYESNYEADEPKADQGEDREMTDGEAPLQLKFRELTYSVETGEAEMISMDFVARGAGNATAVEAREKKPARVAVDTDPKGKRRIVTSDKKDQDAENDAEDHSLSREDEELIASLTAKANAIKMLQSRIKLLTAYLEQLPPSFLSATATEAVGNITTDDSHTVPSNTILRSIQALVHRLALVVPSATQAYENEMTSEANDVNLMTLLDGILQSVTEIREIGKKSNTVETAKAHSRKGMDLPMGMGGGAGFNIPGAGDLTV